jgi:hypothetical protein
LGQLKEYKIDQYNISYKLPSKWEAKSESFAGNEITYNNNFKSETDGISGFVQVWNYDGNLKDFLDMSKKISESDSKVRNFSISDININDKDAYLVEYKIDSHGIIFHAYEYFIKQDSAYIRFCFNINENKTNGNMESIFKAIVETVGKE